MTKEYEKFLEFMSNQEEEVKEKVSQMGKDEVIAFAAKNGFSVTAEDFEPVKDGDGIDLDELDAVAGGACGQFAYNYDRALKGDFGGCGGFGIAETQYNDFF